MQIELRNISKSYNGNRLMVLKDISLSVNQGDSIAITGPSGSGKSTLLNILGTLDYPTSGTVFINDQDITTFSETSLAAIRNTKIGFIFQLHHLLPQLNAIENVLLPVMAQENKASVEASKARALSLLEEVGLSDKATRFPSQLSVGECQRIAVVRAMINEPEIILADEPTGSLDQDAAGKLAELLFKIHKEHSPTLVIVTHSTELAQHAKTIYKIANGKLEV